MRIGTAGRWFVAAAVVAVVLGVVALALRAGAAAPRLTTVDPADGSVIERPPAQVVLTFTVPPDQVHVGVTRANGAAVGSEVAHPADSVVRIPVRIDTVGTYLVGYHAVFSNGHELSGQTRFSVGPAGLAPDDRVDDPAAAPSGHGHDADPLSLLATAVGALGSLVVLTVLLRPRRT